MPMLSKGLRKVALPVAAIGLDDVLRGSAGGAQGPDVAEWHRDRLSSGHHAQTAVGHLETKLKRQILDPVAIVIDVYLVQAVRIPRVVVRTTLRVLKRLIVRDQRDVSGSTGLVAVEHV